MGFFDKLKKINIFASFGSELTDDFYDELEESLILADTGMDTTLELVEELRRRVKAEGIKTMEEARACMCRVIADALSVGDPGLDLSTRPSVVLFIGVNGVGKTTTIGKLANYFVREKKSVTLAAADTFRAAAIDQLEIWANRAKVRIVKHEDGSDPSAVIFDAVSSAKARGTDVVLVDTAGRLHVKDNLMKELQKMDRVVTREYPEAQFVKLLVLDATTGQNAMNQAKIFDEAVELDGIVLTKLDGTAKGGFVFSLCGELKIPVVFAGVGEKIDDLELFDAEQFVEGFL